MSQSGVIKNEVGKASCMLVTTAHKKSINNISNCKKNVGKSVFDAQDNEDSMKTTPNPLSFTVSAESSNL